MKKAMKTFGLLLLVVLFTANVQAQVKSDYDKNTNFSKYKTYTFGGWEKESDKILTNFDKKRITDAMAYELNSRGMKYVESGGDAVITLFIVVNQKTSTTAYTNYNGGMGYYGRRGWGMGYGGMGISSSTTYNENDYLEGTFVVDMYDNTSKELVWQGIITTVVKEKPEKREKTIPKKVKKLMKKYPVKPMK
jgi:hypothetical protein